MALTIETEIKLAASPTMLEVLRDHPKLRGSDQSSFLATTYFDTLGGRLRRNGAALRIRESGGNREQTLKLPVAAKATIRRQEWHASLTGDLPEPSAFPGNGGRALLRLLDGAQLTQVGRARIERTIRRIDFRGSAIEVTFDLGTIEAGSNAMPVSELELELIDGRLADVVALALELPLGPDLTWSVLTKSERCHQLAFGLSPVAISAQALKLASGIGPARGFQAIAWNCLTQLLENYPLVVESGGSEAVHQSRVAIRRLRAAISLFGDFVDDETLPILDAELKAAATALGPARDLDVVLQQIKSICRVGNSDTDELKAHLANERDKAIREAQAILSTPQFQRLLLEIAAWIEGGAWLAHRSESREGQLFARFAASILAHRRRKLRKARGRLAAMPDDARHRLRIAAKKLRYATEFFASLYRGKATTPNRQSFARALARLQDNLGELNDLAAATAGRHLYFTALEPITAAKLESQFHALLAARQRSRRKLLKRAEAALEQVADGPAWWSAS